MKANNLKILKQIRAENNPKSKYNDILDKMIAEETEFNGNLLTVLKTSRSLLNPEDTINKTKVLGLINALTEEQPLTELFTKEQSLALIRLIKEVIRREKNKEILGEIRNLEF